MRKPNTLRKKIPTGHPIERPLAIAGLGLVLLGSISSIFYAHLNQTFIEQSLLSAVYYLNYLILLGGGFAIGFAFTRKGQHKLFGGVTYALLAFMLYSCVDIVRFVLSRLTGGPHYPLSVLAFEGAPLAALGLTLIVALFVQLKPQNRNVGRLAKWLFIITFVIAVGFPLAEVWYFEIFRPAGFINSGGLPAGTIILQLLSNSFVVACAAYLLFKGVASQFERLFYAVFIGAFAHTLLYVAWNFRTNPSLDFTNRFESATMIGTLLIVILVLWAARKAINTPKATTK